MSRDPEVLSWQKRMMDVGVYSGEIDGDFGPKTLLASLALIADRKTVAQSAAVDASLKPDPVAIAARATGWLDRLLPMLKEFEGFRAEAYWDRDGKVWTIGYGTTRFPDGRAVKKGDHGTRSDALNWLINDVTTIRAPEIRKLATVPLTDNQTAALVSLAYNIGNGGLAKSSVLAAVNAGKSGKAIATEFAKYTHAGGKVLPGLVTRRANEAALFNS